MGDAADDLSHQHTMASIRGERCVAKVQEGCRSKNCDLTLTYDGRQAKCLTCGYKAVYCGEL